jgi:molybdenum cofactor cytidylyltransferase
MVPGLILASGRSSRMQRSKALLPCGGAGETFVRCLARALGQGGVAETLVIGRPGDDALRSEVAAIGGTVRFVDNPDADTGQLSSVLAGLRAADAPAVAGILVAPVDMPSISADTVAALLAVFRTTGAPIVRAVHRGRHGHPVIFARTLFGELARADPSLGAKAVVRAHDSAIVNVEVDDPGVLTDVDTPEDYLRVFGRPI